MKRIFFVLFLLIGFKMFGGTNYGTWETPITAEKIAEKSNAILSLHCDRGSTYWCEMRPSNQGRCTVVRLDQTGMKEDITPPDFNVRTFVHEYGGGAFTVSNGIVYASNGKDGAVYIIRPKQAPVKLTSGEIRFADMHVTSFGLVAVGESHEKNKPIENFLALIDTKTGNHKKLASGYDFYSSPDISPDGKKIAWICWNHPNMPWTNTELWIAEFDEEGNLRDKKQIAGSSPESIFQPQWSLDGSLYFVSDRKSGWWNLYHYVNNEIKNICPMEAEIAEPLWVFELSTYAFLGNKIAFTYNRDGRWYLAILDPKTGKLTKIEREGTHLHQFRSNEGSVQFLEHYPNKCKALVQIDDAQGFPTKVLESEPDLVDQGYISVPTHITFPSNGRVAHAYFYLPTNKDYASPSNEKPPLIVEIHGGPTGQASNALQLSHQFWTSRGFALLDVNYGGSTGYGRDYRNLLDHNWGVVDVEDCVNGALFLVEEGLVDGNRLIIRGGSAGGYTTLAALAFTNVFKAGASYYGIADITALTNDTHKFESFYSDQLIGKYPEEKALWESRSPINSVEKISAPLILFQGEDDLIVPKNQSIMIYEALKQRGIPVELHIYPGEEHGFRQAKHIIHSLNTEAEFYQKVFGLGNQD